MNCWLYWLLFFVLLTARIKVKWKYENSNPSRAMNNEQLVGSLQLAVGSQINGQLTINNEKSVFSWQLTISNWQLKMNNPRGVKTLKELKLGRIKTSHWIKRCKQKRYHEIPAYHTPQNAAGRKQPVGIKQSSAKAMSNGQWVISKPPQATCCYKLNLRLCVPALRLAGLCFL